VKVGNSGERRWVRSTIPEKEMAFGSAARSGAGRQAAPVTAEAEARNERRLK
jgi:hypothetical protein